MRMRETDTIQTTMGSVNSIPVVSQAKSAVQAVAGDTKGAKEPQRDFLDTCPVVSQGTSFYHWWYADNDAARETQVKFGRSTSDCANGVPVVGHIKGGIHYACGDKDGGDNAMKSASRSTGVFIGGAVGGLVAGPFGAITGGVTGGAALDGITTGVDSAVHGEYRPAGQVAAVTSMIEGNATVGDVFDSAVGVAFDGVTGYIAGKAAVNLRDARNNVKLYRVADKAEVSESVKAGKLVKSQAANGGEVWMSESSKHTVPYYESRPSDGKSVMKVEVPRDVYSKMKADMIPQESSRAVQMTRAAEGKGPANIFNTERLQNHPKSKVNIGIKGKANMEIFNQHVQGVEGIQPESLQYKSSGVHRYGRRAAGSVLHVTGEENPSNAGNDSAAPDRELPGLQCKL